MGMADQSKKTLASRRKKPNRKRRKKKEEIGSSLFLKLFLTPWNFQLLIGNLSIIKQCVFDADIHPEAWLPPWDTSLFIQLSTLVASLECLVGIKHQAHHGQNGAHLLPHHLLLVLWTFSHFHPSSYPSWSPLSPSSPTSKWLPD